MCLAKWEDGRGYNWHVLHGSSLSAEHLTPLERHMEDGVLAACRVRLPGLLELLFHKVSLIFLILG